MSAPDLYQLESIASGLFDAFNRRDLEAALGLLHPEIIFRPVSAALMRGGEAYRGHDGMRTYFADIEAHWEELIVHPVHIRAAGQAVVALGEVTGRAKTDSFKDRPTKWVLKFREHLVISVHIFTDELNIPDALGP